MSVNGAIQAKEVVVNTGWSDYVFSPDYALQSLSETGLLHRTEPSPARHSFGKGCRRERRQLGEMQAKLLGKNRGITLHLIHDEEEIAQLKKSAQKAEESK